MNAKSSPSLDQDHLEELYVRLEKPIYNVVYRWVWDREEARDIMQEAFVRLWRMQNRVRLETVEPLLYRIAMNLAAKSRRSRKIRRWITLDSTSERASDSLDSAELLETNERNLTVRRAVDALPERLRRIVLLCEFSEMTYEQIGHLLGIPAGTVGSRRSTALMLLQKRLRHIVEGNHGR
jgi:RNA polymerase sigma-70 factor (ECF subfamily)